MAIKRNSIITPQGLALLAGLNGVTEIDMKHPRLKKIKVCVLCDGWGGKHNKGCVWVKYMEPKKQRKKP